MRSPTTKFGFGGSDDRVPDRGYLTHFTGIEALRPLPQRATEGEGPGIGKGDVAIAATALQRDESVLAGDSHFATIPGVSVETYR